MEWLSLHSEALVDQADAQDLLTVVRQVSSLNDLQASRLDYAFRQWTAREISRAADVEALVVLDDLIYLSREKLPNEHSATQHLSSRWQAFRDLLESKRLAIAGAGAGKASRLVHTKRIEELLAGRQMTQSELRRELGLTAARVSQILGVLEEERLILRQRRGKENLVSLASARPVTEAPMAERRSEVPPRFLVRQLAA